MRETLHRYYCTDLLGLPYSKLGRFEWSFRYYRKHSSPSPEANPQLTNTQGPQHPNLSFILLFVKARMHLNYPKPSGYHHRSTNLNSPLPLPTLLLILPLSFTHPQAALAAPLIHRNLQS